MTDLKILVGTSRNTNADDDAGILDSRLRGNDDDERL